MKPIPFKIDRNNTDNIPEQLANGFKTAILGGYYKPGDRLPTFSQIVAELGVSIRAPRDAMKILVAENYVRARQRIGCEVLPREGRIWRGRVLCALFSGYEGSYYISVMVGAIRKALVSAGYAFVPVLIDKDAKGHVDYAAIDAAIAEPFDFVLTVYPNRELSDRIARCGIPALAYVDVQDSGTLACVRFSPLPLVTDLVRRVGALGVRQVLMVEYAPAHLVAEAFRGQGMSVERMGLRPAENAVYLESIMHLAMVRLSRRLASSRKAMPDLIVFTDDYVAVGGLMALAARGVKVPADVKVVTLANRGFTPPFPVSLARVEIDPRHNGEEIAQQVLARIEGRPPMPLDASGLTFVPGDSCPGLTVE